MLTSSLRVEVKNEQNNSYFEYSYRF